MPRRTHRGFAAAKWLDGLLLRTSPIPRNGRSTSGPAACTVNRPLFSDDDLSNVDGPTRTGNAAIAHIHIRSSRLLIKPWLCRSDLAGRLVQARSPLEVRGVRPVIARICATLV